MLRLFSSASICLAAGHLAAFLIATSWAPSARAQFGSLKKVNFVNVLAPRPYASDAVTRERDFASRETDHGPAESSDRYAFVLNDRIEAVGIAVDDEFDPFSRDEALLSYALRQAELGPLPDISTASTSGSNLLRQWIDVVDGGQSIPLDVSHFRSQDPPSVRRGFGGLVDGSPVATEFTALSIYDPATAERDAWSAAADSFSHKELADASSRSSRRRAATGTVPLFPNPR